jgi:hypothetical protein
MTQGGGIKGTGKGGFNHNQKDTAKTGRIQDREIMKKLKAEELDVKRRRLYYIGTMKRYVVSAFLVLGVLISCGGDPSPRPTQSPAAARPDPAPVEVPEPPASALSAAEEQAFDPSSITQEERDNTKTEIQQLIQQLNGIIRAKNYNSWVSYLDRGYFAAISSPEYLERVSKSPILVKQKIVLNSAQDYFNHVVVPSRTNDRVDEIEFISRNRVKAYTINNAGNRLRLYDLERTGGGWKIIN